jgi:uncharacterized membrane protein
MVRTTSVPRKSRPKGAAKPPRTHPRLASDAFRGWIPAVIVVPFILFGPWLLTWLGADVDASTATVATVFIAWSSISVLTAALTLAAFRRASSEELRRWLRETEPPKRTVVLWNIVNGGGATGWAVSGSLLAVTAVLILSFVPDFRESRTVVYTGIAVVVSSLALTISSYAVRYAREWAGDRGGIVFPGGQEPTFMDFNYLAIQVSTTFSSSDVTIQRTHARRVVSVHSLIAFAFNTIIVALLVSVLVNVAV